MIEKWRRYPTARRKMFTKLSGNNDSAWDDHQIALWLALHEALTMDFTKSTIERIQDELGRLDHAIVYEDEIDGG